MRRASDIFAVGPMAAACVLACGCGLGVVDADPMPSPGDPDASLVLVSASNALGDDGVGQVGLIGLPHAVKGAGFLEISDASSAVTVVAAGARGSFAAVVSGAAGDRLSIVYRETRDGPPSRPVQVIVNAYSSLAGAPPTPETGAWDGENGPAGGGTSRGGAWIVVSAPDSHGLARIDGHLLQPGEIAVIGNTRTAQVLELEVDAAGDLFGTLPAAAGDTLVVIVSNPNAKRLPSEVASLRVPAP